VLRQLIFFCANKEKKIDCCHSEENQQSSANHVPSSPLSNQLL